MTHYEVLTLYPDKTCRDTGKAVALVKVHFKPCPDGFAQSMDKCDCEERLFQYNAKCTINGEGKYVITKGNFKFWVKALYTNETDKEGYQGLILYKSCPTDYCKNVNLNISLEELQFAFPIYIWVLISVIIITSRYSGFMTRLIGSNPIAVLATLLLMSYAKILKTIIQIYSFVHLDHPNNIKVKVRLKDANMPYLEGHHLLLAVFGSIFIAVFFLPYTVLLLSGYKLYRYSNKLCIHWFMLKLKPLLDSYYAPYLKHTRYWIGFLLFLHCGLYTVFTFNSIRGSKKSFLAIITAYTAVIIIAWLSVKIYKNFYVNVIEATVYLDLIILSAATSKETNSPALVYTLVGFVFTVMIGIIFFQFHLLYLAKSTIWFKITSKYKSFKVLMKKQENMAENERSPLNPSVTDNDTTTSDIKFRESLLEDF